MNNAHFGFLSATIYEYLFHDYTIILLLIIEIILFDIIWALNG